MLDIFISVQTLFLNKKAMNIIQSEKIHLLCEFVGAYTMKSSDKKSDKEI